MPARTIAQVEKAIASGDSQARMTMLRRMTTLFADRSEEMSEQQLAVFDDVIVKMAQTVETIARASLARSIADNANGLPRVVRDLAFDPSASVAAPVLSRAERLSDSDLFEIASARGQDHLFAISRRRTLSERVTDVLVVRGDQSVVRSVAGNEGARFSDSGFSILTERAGADETLRDTLALRKDVPPAHMARIVAIARQRAAENLAGEFGAAAVSEAVGAATRGFERGASSVSASVREFDEQVAASNIDLSEKQIATWINEGKTSDALIALARVAHVAPEMAFRAFQAPDFEPLLFLIRSVKFGWGTFKLFLQAKPGKTPSAEDLRGAFEAFQALSVATAQRVVRFTVAREQAQKTDAA